MQLDYLMCITFSLPSYLYQYMLIITMTKNATFRKRFPEWNFFENDTVAYSCGHPKTELCDLALPLALLSILLAFDIRKRLNLVVRNCKQKNHASYCFRMMMRFWRSFIAHALRIFSIFKTITTYWCGRAETILNAPCGRKSNMIQNL